MTTAWIVAGVIVPWAAGAGAAARLGDERTRWPMVVGAGWLFGQAMTIGGLYLSLMITGAGHARALLGIEMLASAWLWASVRVEGVPRRSRGLREGSRRGSALRGEGALREGRVAGAGLKVLLAIIGTSLAARLAIMVVAVGWVPIRGDDAISIWLFKAKVIASLDHMPTDPAGDFYLGGSNPRYPVFCSLMSAWLPLVTGEWDERLAVVPWPLCHTSVVLLIAGTAWRRLGAGASWSLAYLVGSLPLAAVHVCRPGYADLMLGAFLAGMVAYLMAWSETDRPGELIAALVLAVLAACMKREGPGMAGIAAAVIMGCSWRLVWGWTMGKRLAVGAGAGIAALGVIAVMDFTEQREAALGFGYRPEVWGALYRHMFEWSSFNHLFYLIAGGAGLAVLRAVGWPRGLKPAARRGECVGLLVAAGLCGLVAGIFALTPEARFALNDQTPSRLFLQVAPAIVLVLGVGLGTTLGFCPAQGGGEERIGHV